MHDDIMRGKDNIIPKLGQTLIQSLCMTMSTMLGHQKICQLEHHAREGVCTLCEPNSKLKIIWQDNLTPSRGGRG